MALSLFPDPVTGEYKDDGWEALGEELNSLLSAAEYESARRTTFNAFYTAPVVIDAMHGALKRLGVPANATVLEPGCGTGNFMGRAPNGMKFIGVELDCLSGRIARVLHPGADIRIENFRDTKLPGELDAVIGNPPFADVRLDFKGEMLPLHDYFIAKGLDSLRPGGVVAVVTSHFTLDKQNAAVRERLAEQAHFLGAIRLPSDAFKKEGTAVVTDIVFLRRRAPGEPANHVDPEWIKSDPLEIDGKHVAINRYFHRHPEMVLGSWSRQDRLYGSEDGYSIKSTGDLASQLKAAVECLPRFEPLKAVESTKQQEPFVPPPLDPHIGAGSFFVASDKSIRQVNGGQTTPVTHGTTLLSSIGTMMGRRLASLIGLRDLARRVLQSQNEGWPEEHRQKARKELNRAYDQFHGLYGPINKTSFSETAEGTVIRRMPNVAKFCEDPDAMLVLALEDYDELTGKAVKAPILLHDVVGKAPPVTSVQSAEEGLLVSLDQKGGVDLPFISEIYGKPEGQVLQELGDLIFQDPDDRSWQTADAYLSGNVCQKLANAESAGPNYARNAEALRAVQPEDVLPGEIDAKLGAPWIPAEDIQAFGAHLFGVEPKSMSIAHLKRDAVWSVEADYSACQSVVAQTDYGTTRANGTGLLELALNMKTPVIYDTIAGPDGDERVVNQEETLAAREKQKLIKEAFRVWIFSEPERTERLVRIYNDTYNNLRPRLFDGSHLDFPGMSNGIALRPRQKDAVWRGMSSGNTLLAHCVGAGKTYTMAATGMKRKQAGLSRKPMYVVPNHMLEQFAREFMQLYPNARLLVATKDDVERSRRKLLTAKIASGQWDGIILTHSSFEKIAMSKEFQERFLRDQIHEYDELLKENARASGAQRNLIKTIEKQKVRRESKLKDLLAEDKKDDGLVFDELGVDHLFIDEAHYFKNLETPTKMDRVAGIQTGGSERAFDLYMKARYLSDLHPGHGVTFATGTPISNTMVEMYTMQRFLDPEGLCSRGIEAFDGWAATFGEVVDTMEISPDGASLRPRSRFAKFTNLPELGQMFRSFADVQTAEMLDLPRPQLKTGKPIVLACPMSEEQRVLQERLIERYERIRSQKIDPREDNALAITTDGRKLALDPRLLSADARDHPNNKINTLVDHVHAIWQETSEKRGTQMIFSDMGVNPTPWGFSPYDEIVAKLNAKGVPKEQIAVIGDADTDAKKHALFGKVRSGSVRILLGSTQKMGTGTNVQKRLVALHHLDAPWKPAEVEQREGRILRQGNENQEVAIYRYVTQQSFDSFMWQALETKARFINQVMTGDGNLRQAEDIGEQELSFAEVKAIASGNPAVLTLAETDAELQRLSILRKNHSDEQFLARRSVRELPGELDRMEDRLSKLESDAATLRKHEQSGLIVNGKRIYQTDEFQALNTVLDRIPAAVLDVSRIPLGNYEGLTFGLILHPLNTPELYLEGATTRCASFSSQRPGPRAVLNALDRLGSSYPQEVMRAARDVNVCRAKLRDFELRLGSTFPHEKYYSELAELRDQLKLSLSVQASNESQSATEIAEAIKTLRAGQIIDSTPVRSGSRKLTGEEPITARIRRKLKALVAPEAQQTELASASRESALHDQDFALQVLGKGSEVNPAIISIRSNGSTTMARKPKVPTALDTSESADTATLETTATDLEPDSLVSHQTDEPSHTRYAADPRPWHTINLGGHNGGPSMELRRSFKYKQMQIAFNGEQPDEKHLTRLKEFGWTDRTETEGIWTKQVRSGEWKTVYDAERLFTEIGNAIRHEKGLPSITPLSQSVGA